MSTTERELDMSIVERRECDRCSFSKRLAQRTTITIKPTGAEMAGGWSYQGDLCRSCRRVVIGAICNKLRIATPEPEQLVFTEIVEPVSESTAQPVCEGS